MKRFWEINKEACFWKQVSFKKIFFKYKTSNGKLLFSLFLFNFRDMDRNLLFLIFKTVIEEIVCSSQIVERTGGHLIEFHLIESVDRKFLII
jgi:hypothetical protein